MFKASNGSYCNINAFKSQNKSIVWRKLDLFKIETNDFYEKRGSKLSNVHFSEFIFSKTFFKAS